MGVQMGKFKIVILEHGYSGMDLERSVVEKQGGALADATSLPKNKLFEACHDAQGILLRRMQISREIMKTHLQSVKVIVRYGVGVDNVDLDAATDLGIIVSRVPDYCLEEVSDHAVALTLALGRGLFERHGVMKAGGWDDPRKVNLNRFSECIAGLLAFGQIARRTARKLSSWNLRLIAHDPYIEQGIISATDVLPVSFEVLLKESDYLIMHAPLFPENRHIINAESISKMKTGSYLINTGRGPLVDANALADALKSGKLAGAALDVFETEPLPSDSPLRSIPNLILTDHVAWYSEQSQRQLQLSAAAEAARGASGGLPKTIANPEVLVKLGRAAEWPGDAASGWMNRRSELLGLTGKTAGKKKK
jgi:D-3-phosphoglycerate dehydrogenase / 2-oxoglutarate reductase